MSGARLRPERPGFWLTEVETAGVRVRGAVFVGASRSVVWDTLCRPADMAPVRSLIAGHECVVVYSHADWDHAWGTGGLDEPSAVVAHRAAARRMVSEAPAELAEKRAEDPALWSDVVLVPPTVTFGDRHDLALGGFTLELHTLPGHTDDTIVGFVPELGVLLAGDAVETPLPLLGQEGDPDEWAGRLEAWAEDPRLEWVVPSHGPTGGGAMLLRNAAYLRALSGGDFEPPAGLDAFYREAHRVNLERARARRR